MVGSLLELYKASVTASKSIVGKQVHLYWLGERMI